MEEVKELEQGNCKPFYKEETRRSQFLFLNILRQSHHDKPFWNSRIGKTFLKMWFIWLLCFLKADVMRGGAMGVVFDETTNCYECHLVNYWTLIIWSGINYWLHCSPVLFTLDSRHL